jgi:hypothetical protein
MRHVPECVPTFAGATIGMRMSTVALTGVAERLTAVLLVIASPPIKTSWNDASQAHVPLFRNRQILLKGCEPTKFVPSGTVTSATKLEL